MIDIVTHPHTDERNNRQWKTEGCHRACIQGNKESMVPDICPHYEKRLAVERCHKDEEQG